MVTLSLGHTLVFFWSLFQRRSRITAETRDSTSHSHPRAWWSVPSTRLWADLVMWLCPLPICKLPNQKQWRLAHSPGTEGSWPLRCVTASGHYDINQSVTAEHSHFHMIFHKGHRMATCPVTAVQLVVMCKTKTGRRLPIKKELQTHSH